MLSAKLFLSFCVVSVSVFVGYSIGQTTQSLPVEAENSTAKVQKTCDLLTEIKEDSITSIQAFDIKENEFISVVRQLGSSQKLSIYNESGKVIYELEDLGVANIQSVRFLTPNSREIMIETNGGGTDNFLEIPDYQNGEFVPVIDSSKTQLRGGYFTMLQYRNTMKGPYFKPSQLIVIQQIGGADENPLATVFRSQDGKFQNVGSFSMRKLGNFIEKEISEK